MQMSQIKERAPLLLFLILGILALALSVTRPMHNWDMVIYAAAAKSFDEKDITRIHSFVYSRLHRSVPEDEFKELAAPQGNDPDSVYRNIISSNPKAMSEQLPLFQIRPAYTGLIYIMYKLGINIYFATHLVSGLAVFAGIILLYFISKSALPGYMTYLVPFGSAAAGVLSLAKYSTPDGLAFCAVIITVYLLIKSKMRAVLVFLPLITAVRTDLIMYILPFCMILLAGGWGKKRGICASALVSIAIYILINTWYSNPGWSTTFHSEFMEVSAYPLSSVTEVSSSDYLRVLLREAGNLFLHKKFLVYLPASAASLIFILSRTGRKALAGPITAAATASILYVIIHFLIFPDAHERFFSAQYITGGIAFLYVTDNFFLSGRINRKGRKRDGRKKQ